MHRLSLRTPRCISFLGPRRLQYLGALPLALIPCRSLRRGSVTRHHASIARQSQDEEFNEFTEPWSIAKVNRFTKLPRSQSPDTWVPILETFLPQRFRQKSEHPHGHDDAEKDKASLREILEVLRCARVHAGVDLLSYIGIRQGRWQIVDWFVEAMLLRCENYKQEDEPSRQLSAPLWAAEQQTLDEMTSAPIVLNHPDPSPVALSTLYCRPFPASYGTETVARQCLAHIWQALGSIFLVAQDHAVQVRERQKLISQALNILAQMHHINALPETMYNYATARDRTIVQRPPTLYLLSARMMTVLSDVAWKRHWVSEMKKAKEYGYELPEPRVQPQLPDVGTEVWLEFVLWACVEGGWISEAAWILHELGQTRLIGDNAWSTISWDEICDNKAPKLEWTEILKLQIDRARLNQTTGIGIANSGTSSIDMGPRTISREVVSAIMDGVVNIAAMTGQGRGTQPRPLQRSISVFVDLLGRGDLGVNTGAFNAMLLRIIESVSLGVRDESSHIIDIIQMSPILEDAYHPDQSTNMAHNENNMDLSASLLGLLHQLLHASADQGSYPGVMKLLENIQNVIDANRNTYIQEFAFELRERLKQGEENFSPLSNTNRKASPLLHPQIPPYVLSRILDFVVENKFIEMGQWLIHNDDIEGGIIQPHMYASTNLQPALLRFATATADNSALNSILEQLRPPLPSTTLHALLHCQIAMNKWDAVQDILRHFQSMPDLQWTSDDVLSIGAAVLRLSTSKKPNGNAASKARTVLIDILQGRYDPAIDPSQRRDFSIIQQANQLKRILRSVAGNTFASLAYEYAREAGRLSNRYPVSASAFSILLDTVVEQFGASAGQKLWLKWCLAPHDPMIRRMYSPHDDADVMVEKVVEPTIYLLRIVVRPIAQKLRQYHMQSKANTRERVGGIRSSRLSMGSAATTAKNGELAIEELSLLEWAMPLFRGFGMEEKAINSELPGVFQVLDMVQDHSFAMP